MRQHDHNHENDYLELICNLHSICEALAYDGLESASGMLRERMRHIRSFHGDGIPLVDGMILVTSLNRSLYDFFQFYMHVSFTKCCYENRVRLDNMETDDAILRAGIKVLADYHKAFSNSREICNHMEKARSYIREHLADKLTLESVGKAVHISGGYLSHIFSSLAGQSFCDYIRDERMAMSRHLLIQTDYSIDEISARCGFCSPNYFATVFKQYMGRSPSAYRRNVK